MASSPSGRRARRLSWIAVAPLRMNLIDAALHRIATDLDRHGHHWALVGGFAVSARSEPRFTRDVDVAVAVPNDDTAELAVHTLVADGYGIIASIEHDEARRLATIRLSTTQDTPDEDVIVDPGRIMKVRCAGARSGPALEARRGAAPPARSRSPRRCPR